jgi:hypothetical protein
MRRRIILAFGLLATINPMKSFKIFLAEMAPPEEKMQCDIDGICRVIREYESAGNEEKVRTRYLDSKNLPTIGHGHLITKDSPKIFAEVFPEEHKKDPEFGNKVLSGKSSLTSNQVETLFKRDVSTRIPQIQKMVPNFNTMSSELQAQIASEHFRGMVQKSPKAVEYINSGEYAKAADEYLNAKDYRDATGPNPKSRGIAKRMMGLATALRTEEKRQKKLQQSS